MNPLLLFTLIGAGVLFISAAERTTNALSISILRIEKFDRIASGIKIVFSVAVDNPTNQSFTIKRPNITALVNGNEIGNSIPTSQTVTIKANDRTAIDDMNIQIPFSKAPFLLMALFNGKTDSTVIDIVISSTIGGFPVKTKMSYPLKDIIGANGENN